MGMYFGHFDFERPLCSDPRLAEPFLTHRPAQA
jgi:hypothetical protein